MTDAPKESQEPGAPKEPPYKEVSETELKRVLAEHEKWLQTDGEEGAQANLREADLQGADLHGAKLQSADLRDADLRDADLTEAEFLTQEQLDEACGDEETKLSEGLTIETCSEDK